MQEICPRFAVGDHICEEFANNYDDNDYYDNNFFDYDNNFFDYDNDSPG